MWLENVFINTTKRPHCKTLLTKCSHRVSVPWIRNSRHCFQIMLQPTLGKLFQLGAFAGIYAKKCLRIAAFAAHLQNRNRKYGGWAQHPLLLIRSTWELSKSISIVSNFKSKILFCLKHSFNNVVCVCNLCMHMCVWCMCVVVYAHGCVGARRGRQVYFSIVLHSTVRERSHIGPGVKLAERKHCERSFVPVPQIAHAGSLHGCGDSKLKPSCLQSKHSYLLSTLLFPLFKMLLARQWWCKRIIPTLGRQR